MNERATPETHEPALTGSIGDIAIVGMAGRFPGAASPDALWEMVSEGRHAFSTFDPDEIEDAFDGETRGAANYVAARPCLDDVGQFDAAFFGLHPREAALIDPQFRVFLEICWEALESAGCDPYTTPSAIGVFAGSAMSTYLINNVLSDRHKAEQFTSGYQVSMFSELIGSINDTLATRVAYKLNLRGPAFTVQSACSTSLLAVTQACQNLLTYSCDMALAGGVSITFPQKRGYLYQEGGMVSPDGHCRPFEARAAGTVFGSGAGAVLLKRLDEALRDGDPIHAIIRGWGVNNDGADKVGFTAPSVSGQADAIATALASADVAPESIGYVECHGTATPLGDPIEFEGLMQAFGAGGARNACALGSVKGNLGHLDAAAGVTGLIKAVLALRHAKIPPLAGFADANPRIDLDNSPFYIPRALQAWTTNGGARRAGVSSFGVGGTNVHVVLEEAPAAPEPEADEGTTYRILPLSARDETALAEMRANLAETFRQAPPPLAASAHTLQRGRHHFPHRAVVVARDTREALAELESERIVSGRAGESAPPVVFMFPGQGAQYAGMGGALYESEPEFARWIDRGAGLLAPAIGVDIREFLRPGTKISKKTAQTLRETTIAQPALFLVAYATARLWMSRGLVPDAMIGHSVGEFVAATLANVMAFDDGLRLVAARGKLMQEQPKGAMLSVRTDAETARAHLGEGADIAAVNAPRLSVVSGTFAGIDATCASLERAGIAFSRLHTSHAFHSGMMEAAAAAFGRETETMHYGAATIPYVSCVTGDWQTDAQGTAPGYWARHCREAVHFAAGLATLCRDTKPVLLEVGPGRTLSTFAAQTIGRDGRAAIVQSLPEHDRAAMAERAFAEAHGRLWIAGCTLDWPAPAEGAQRKVALPTYPFQRRLHWIEAPAPIRRDDPAPVTAREAAPIPTPTNGTESMTTAPSVPSADRSATLETALLGLLADLSGEDLPEDAAGTSFLELGFDSLFIGQFAQKLEKRHKVKLSFRDLLGPIPSVVELARHLDAAMPADAEPLAQSPGQAAPAEAPPKAMPAPAGAGLEALFQSQMQAMQQLFAQQMQTVQSLGGGAAGKPVAAAPAAPAVSTAGEAGTTEKDGAAGGRRAALYWPGARAESAMTPEQDRFVRDLVRRYAAKNAKSRAFTETNRPHLADPRAASGFRTEWKDMIFPLVSDRSKGARIWDIDGNEYIDLVNGMGQTAFGHAPDFVVRAIVEQAESGFAIGPQTPLAGEVAGLIGEMTGHQRVTFCNTGSEAVMAAMRVARTVTGRERVVVFANDYHGQFDEVLVKGRSRSGQHAALPLAAGIPPGSVANMTVLAYGAPESLEWIRSNAADIAAVIVEPVQSRHPELRPADFVRDLRAIATQGEFALVFDEVVTGFRVHPGGMQAVWGIKGDMATYGKVLGGGMPIGVLAGDSRFMDALDGGHWAYGDDSVPSVAPTFFAGTFVRHPVVLAASRAVLRHIKGEGAALYERVAARTGQLVEQLNDTLSRRGIECPVNGYSSWFVTDFGSADPLGALFYPLARLAGLHVQEGYPCFATTAHSEDDFRRIADVFDTSLDALQQVGILAPARHAAAPRTGVEPCTLTEAQKEIWLAAQAGDAASCAFNESFNLALEGAFDEDAFRRAFDLVVARHDALHIRFSRAGDSFTIAPERTIALPMHDLAQDEAPEAGLDDLVALEARTPFDLVDGPLVRARLARLADARHVLIFTAHHIVCDGWSANVLVDELSDAYAAFAHGRTPDLAQPLSFADYARRRAGVNGETSAAEAYWLKRFATVPEPPELPADRPRPDRRTFAGGTCTAWIDAPTCKRLKKAGAKNGATMFSTLLAAVQTMLARLSGSADIVVAVPSAGQSLLDGETLVGHCVNLLPLRQDVRLGEPFAAHLRETQKLVLEAFEHRDCTYGTLVRKLGLKRDPRRLPLTEIQFNLERVAGHDGAEGLGMRVTPNPKAFSNFDMFLNMIESEEGLRIDVDYNADILERATVERWLGHFAVLVEALAGDMNTALGALPLLTNAQFDWLAKDLNDSAAEFDREAFVYDLFARQVARNPDAVAAEHEGMAVTYGELDARSWQLARHIHDKVFIPGRRVAVALDRSIDMLVALLAVMKAGHIYVPLDPEHPEARLRRTMEAARISALLCAGEATAALAGKDVTTIRLDAERALIDAQESKPLERRTRHATSAAYIIFTSGSTGAPKGVEVPHRALVNFLVSMAERPGFTSEDTLLAVTTVSFDIAALELYLPLIAGGKVVIADRIQVRDGFALVDLIDKSGATVLQATPTLWQMLVEAGLADRPRLKMLSGGEPLPRALARSLKGIGGELWNMYGPTETTIWSSAARIDDPDAPITIGAPIANTQLHILDSADNLAPVGVVGELHIGGEGLAIGYFENRAQTEAAFRQVAIDGKAPQRLYGTGDIGRRLPDGSLQLLGRRDNQIKLRGFRIELGEIEAVVGRADGVRHCAAVVVASDDGERRIVCHVVAADPDTPPVAEALTAHARAHLPDHMVPGFWVPADALPQTANGKLDRKALEKRGIPQRGTSETARIPPRTPMEKTLSGIWREVLDVGEIGVDENLYALGADSLSIFRIAARMMDAGLPLEARHLLGHPTIGALARCAEERGENAVNGTRPHIPALKDFRNGARRGVEGNA